MRLHVKYIERVRLRTYSHSPKVSIPDGERDIATSYIVLLECRYCEVSNVVLERYKGTKKVTDSISLRRTGQR